MHTLLHFYLQRQAPVFSMKESSLLFSLIIYSWTERKRQHTPAVRWDDSDLVFVEGAIDMQRARKREVERDGGRDKSRRNGD